MSITTPLAPPVPDCPGGGTGFAAALAGVHAGLERLAGASSTRAYLVATHHLTPAAAAGMVAAARGMNTRCETTRAAWAAGDLSTDQAIVIAAAVDRLGADVDTDTVTFGQSQLIDHASRLTHPELQQLANHLVEVVDPDGADAILAARLEADEHRARQQTTFRGRKGADGTARFCGRIPNLHYDLLTRALHAYTAPRHPTAAPTTTRPAEADGVLGRVDAGTDPVTAPYPQRLGQAFCELLEHLPANQLPQHGLANATVVITVDEHHLRTGLGEATLDTGGTVSISETRRLACNAHLIPAVLDSQSRLLDLGTSRRLYNRHQRLALALRDQGCVFPGCDRPPPWTEAHHLLPWSAGGPTNLTNGCLLCPYHHHLIHHSDWTLTRAPDGIIDATPPPHLDPTQQPRRHHRYQPRRQ